MFRELERKIFCSCSPDVQEVLNRSQSRFGANEIGETFCVSVSSSDDYDVLDTNAVAICQALKSNTSCKSFVLQLGDKLPAIYPVHTLVFLNSGNVSGDVQNYNLIESIEPSSYVLTGARFYFLLDREGRYEAVTIPPGLEHRMWRDPEDMVGRTLEENLPEVLATHRRRLFDRAVRLNQATVFIHSFDNENKHKAFEIRIVPLGEKVVMTVCDIVSVNAQV